MIHEETIRQMPWRRVRLVLLAMAVVSLLAARPAHASNGTLVVNSIANLADRNAGDGICDADAAIGNLCTLKAAVQEANASSGLDVIAFNIPGSGVHTIQPDAPLAINRFDGEGIRVQGDGNKVEGNFIGTDPSGTQALGNSDNGVSLRGSNNTVGGASPGTRNLISGNRTIDGSGVQIVADQNKVLGNYIGTDKNGTGNLGNDREGVDIFGGSDNIVGDGTSGGADTIAFNKGRGG